MGGEQPGHAGAEVLLPDRPGGPGEVIGHQGEGQEAPQETGERWLFPGIFKVRDGFMRTADLKGPGLGVV